MGTKENGLTLQGLVQRLEALAITYGQPDGEGPLMRRTLLLSSTMALTLLVASGVARAVTRIGTDGPDAWGGTNGDDNLVGKGASDILIGSAKEA